MRCMFLYVLCAHFVFLVLPIFHEAQAWRSLVSLWKIVVLWRLETGRTINPGLFFDLGQIIRTVYVVLVLLEASTAV
ncbi:hypothetical protein AAC387_Pa06g1934 [Persea americana]